MIMQNNGKKQRVWQDIVPVNSRPLIAGVAPKKKRRNLKFPKLSKKSALIIGISLAITIICMSCYLIFINKAVILTDNQESMVGQSSNQENSVITNVGKANPGFSTILPTGKTIENFGGWTLISPEDSDPVYTYTDKIKGIDINVSEQQLPENLKEDTDQKIENLALSFNASQKISADNLTVYVGTSTDGPQSVIFTKNNLLILIKSDTTISNDQWAAYISSLK